MKIKSHFGKMDIHKIEWIDNNIKGTERGVKMEKIFDVFFKVVFKRNFDAEIDAGLDIENVSKHIEKLLK